MIAVANAPRGNGTHSMVAHLDRRVTPGILPDHVNHRFTGAVQAFRKGGITGHRATP